MSSPDSDPSRAKTEVAAVGGKPPERLGGTGMPPEAEGPGAGASTEAPTSVTEIMNGTAGAGLSGTTNTELSGTTATRKPAPSATLPSPIDQAWAELDAEPSSWRSVAPSGIHRHAAPARARQEQDTDIPDIHRRLEPQEAEASGARLVALGGADAGAQFVLSQALTIGRAPGCSIVLSELSVSREHARLFREGDCYYVADQKSGNGTFVNGERVTRHRLASGDEVGFGKARFCFLAEGDAGRPPDNRSAPLPPEAPPAESGARVPTVGAYVLVSLLILLAAVVLALGIVYVRRAGGASERASASQHWATGVAAFAAHEWALAQGQIELYLRLEPNSEQGQRYLERIAREKEFEKQLAAARLALERGDLVSAYTQAAGIGDSVYTTEASEVTRTIDLRLEARVSQARAEVKSGDGKAALELLSAVETIHPGRPEIAALVERAHKQLEDARSSGPEGRSGGASVSDTLMSEAVRLWASGRIDEAIVRAKQAGASRETQGLLIRLQKLKRTYEDAQNAYRAKRAEPAIRLLELARSLDAEITAPLASTVQADIRRQLADMYYVKALEAMREERLLDSYASLQAALANDPGHPTVRKKLDELAARASELLARADSLRQRNPAEAKGLYHLLLQLLPSSDERHRQAGQRLDAMP